MTIEPNSAPTKIRGHYLWTGDERTTFRTDGFGSSREAVVNRVLHDDNIGLAGGLAQGNSIPPFNHNYQSQYSQT
ncbi:hypothetical protein E4T52_09409 [Aureobasidium sp. EXF-3400]|nr:hypothetical protein E4T52_09409 [Aureobasidium sp. EXF-3400]